MSNRITGISKRLGPATGTSSTNTTEGFSLHIYGSQGPATAGGGVISPLLFYPVDPDDYDFDTDGYRDAVTGELVPTTASQAGLYMATIYFEVYTSPVADVTSGYVSFGLIGLASSTWFTARADYETFFGNFLQTSISGTVRIKEGDLPVFYFQNETDKDMIAYTRTRLCLIKLHPA